MPDMPDGSFRIGDVYINVEFTVNVSGASRGGLLLITFDNQAIITEDEEFVVVKEFSNAPSS